MTAPSHDHGSLGEEAARLAEAVQDWLHGGGSRGTGVGGAASPEERDSVVCPACQLLTAVRSARPEVYGHLADAASSLAAALRELVAEAATRESPARPRSDVEHIDLS